MQLGWECTFGMLSSLCSCPDSMHKPMRQTGKRPGRTGLSLPVLLLIYSMPAVGGIWYLSPREATGSCGLASPRPNGYPGWWPRGLAFDLAACWWQVTNMDQQKVLAALSSHLVMIGVFCLLLILCLLFNLCTSVHTLRMHWRHWDRIAGMDADLRARPKYRKAHAASEVSRRAEPGVSDLVFDVACGFCEQAKVTMLDVNFVL